MQILIDGTYACLNPLIEADNLARLGLPAPPDFAIANSVTNPLGPRQARALFVMMRRDLDAFEQNSLHTVTLIEHDEKGNERAKRVLNNLVFINARCLTPGKLADPDASYLAEFADTRWLCQNPHLGVTIDKQYNVPAPDWWTGTPVYYADTTNGGVPWSWQGMVQDVWVMMGAQLGAAPSLPVSPSGVPTSFKFPGMSAWVALNQLLYRVGCAIAWDPTKASNQYSIVQVGASDSTTEAAIDALSLPTAGKKIHDEEFIESNRGRLPAGYRVCFHAIHQDYGTERTTPKNSDQFSTNQVYTIDIPGAFASSTDSNLYAPIWDDLPAIVDAGGAIVNASALSTRANERATDADRMMNTGGSRFYRTFTGLHLFIPGSTLKGVCWRQDLQGIRDPAHPGGWVTEIVRHPYRFLRGMNEQGWVEEDPGSVHLQPPDLSPTYPLYPQLFQTIIRNNGSPTGDLFDSSVQILDPQADSWITLETVWAKDANAHTELVQGTRFAGRLTGYVSSRPLYIIYATSADIPFDGGEYTSEGIFWGSGPGGGGGGSGSFTNIAIYGPTIQFGSSSQSSSVTINVYGNSTHNTTWNFDSNTYVTYNQYITFARISVSVKVAFTFWWDTTVNRLVFYDGTTTWPCGLQVTNTSGLTANGVGSIDLLNTTGGLTFTIDGVDPSIVHFKQVAYQGCTGVAVGIIGGVPPAAAGQQNYLLGGDATWKPLTGDASTFVIEPNSVCSPMLAIRFDSDLFCAFQDPIEDTRLLVTLGGWTDGEIPIGTTGQIPSLHILSQDAKMGTDGKVTVQGIQTQPIKNAAATDAQILVYRAGAGHNQWEQVTVSGDATITNAGVVKVIGWDAVALDASMASPIQYDVPVFSLTGTGDWEAGTLSLLMDEVFGNVQGDILYRDAVSWLVLPAGTNGNVLTTQGAGANPKWAPGGAAPGIVGVFSQWVKYTIPYTAFVGQLTPTALVSGFSGATVVTSVVAVITTEFFGTIVGGPLNVEIGYTGPATNNSAFGQKNIINGGGTLVPADTKSTPIFSGSTTSEVGPSVPGGATWNLTWTPSNNLSYTAFTQGSLDLYVELSTLQ